MRNINIRRSTFKDVLDIFPKMHESDKDEIWASHHILPYFALCDGFNKSEICLTACVLEEPVSMFGVVKNSEGTGAIWMLGTDGLYKTRKEIVALTKKVIATFHEYFPVLHNYVSAKNEKSVRWLEKCGAVIEAAQPFGVEQELFHHFYFKENICVAQL